MTARYCVQCGAGLEPEAAFCVLCGAAAADEVAPDPVDEGNTVIAEDDLLDTVPTEWAPEPAATIVEEPEPMPARLRLDVEDAETGSQNIEFDLENGRSFGVGRDGRSSDYVPGDPRSSRRHFRVELGDRCFLLHDLGSSNGTYVNGERVAGAVEIHHGDVIEYGRSRATFYILREPDPWPSSSTSLR